MIKWNTVLHKKGSITKIHKTLVTPLKKNEKAFRFKVFEVFHIF